MKWQTCKKCIYSSDNENGCILKDSTFNGRLPPWCPDRDYEDLAELNKEGEKRE
jgi:hypothetical protein